MAAAVVDSHWTFRMVQGRSASGATGGALGHWSSRRPGLHVALLCCCILAFTGNANGADSGLASNSLVASWLKPKSPSESQPSRPAQPLGQTRATSQTQNDGGAMRTNMPKKISQLKTDLGISTEMPLVKLIGACARDLELAQELNGLRLVQQLDLCLATLGHVTEPAPPPSNQQASPVSTPTRAPPAPKLEVYDIKLHNRDATTVACEEARSCRMSCKFPMTGQA